MPDVPRDVYRACQPGGQSAGEVGMVHPRLQYIGTDPAQELDKPYERRRIEPTSRCADGVERDPFVDHPPAERTSSRQRYHVDVESLLVDPRHEFVEHSLGAAGSCGSY